MQYHWAEDDLDMPHGAGRLDLPEPVSGKRYIMYHGTTRQNALYILLTGFRQSAGGLLGCGIYLSRDLQKASRYPVNHPEADRVVLKVVVDVGKVISIRCPGHPLQMTWRDFSYDTAWVPPGCGMLPNGLEETCVWDPSRIKITSTIIPRPVPSFYGYGAQGYMAPFLQMQWAEDDSDVPNGVGRVDLPEPVSDNKYIMYHGATTKAAQAILSAGFRQSASGLLGPGVYLSRDLQKASRYPINHPEFDKVVIKVVVDVGKVIAINCQGHPRQKTWHDPRFGEVYDTAWVPPGCGVLPSGLEEDCVWDPNRIQIIKTIKPRPVQSLYGYGAQGYI